MGALGTMSAAWSSGTQAMVIAAVTIYPDAGSASAAVSTHLAHRPAELVYQA